jgi:hypothetical protein
MYGLRKVNGRSAGLPTLLEVVCFGREKISIQHRDETSEYRLSEFVKYE